MLHRFVRGAARRVALVGLAWVAPLACSGSGGSGEGATSGAGGSTSGAGDAGAAISGAAGKSSGGSVSGGASAGGTSGGAGGAGGHSGGAAGSLSNAGMGGGGQVEPGEPCSANCPSGTVQTCFDSCPLGACDNALFFADVPCSTYYPAPISKDMIFCAKGQTATYCLTTIDKLELDYLVSCASGKPTITQCDGGCGVDDSTHAAACN